MTRLINEMFPDHKGCKGPSGARRRINRFMAVADESNLGEEMRRIAFAIVQRPDKTYMAVAFLAYDLGHWTNSLIHSKVCVTN